MTVGLHFIDVSSERWYDTDDDVEIGGIGEMSGVGGGGGWRRSPARKKWRR